MTASAGVKGYRPAPLPSRRPSRKTDPVGSYAHDVVSGRIVAGRLTIRACQRHFDDLERGAKRGLVFSPSWALYAIGFFTRYLRHSKGEWAGQAVVLEPWEEFGVGSVFGWFRKDGTRRFRTAYLEVARKNGKSTQAAGIGIYGLVADREPGAEVFCVATKRDQARLIFTEAQRMVRSSAELRRMVGVFKLNLSVDATGSKFEPLSSDDRTMDGLNPSMILVDELHKHRNRAVLDVLDTALGSRRQPLLWIITTAGDDNPESVYAQENAYSIQVLEGTAPDDSYFAMIFTLDVGDRWDDPKVWIKANPNLNISVKLDDLKRQATKAARSPSALMAFKRLRLNMRVSNNSRAIDMDAWRVNSGGPFDPASLHGRPFFGALDMSSKVDLTAFVKLFPPIDEETRWRIVCRFWMPADSVEEKSDRDRVQYRRWIEEGLVEVTPGNIVDAREIEAAILEDCRLYDARSIAYDPWNATPLAVSAIGFGVPMVEFIQGMRSYTGPTKELEALLASGKLDHGDNAVLAWMASNLHVRNDDNDNRMPTKKHSIGRIDGMAALIMAIGRSMAAPPPVSRYNDPATRLGDIWVDPDRSANAATTPRPYRP